MTIEIFVSSTSEDLKDHCRPVAIGVIGRYAPGANAVIMETWREEHLNPVLVCKSKVQGSTHFVGIIAYRRGWTPEYPGIEGKSITEAEYDWADEFGKPRFILMPEAASKYGYDLYAQAADQSQKDKDAQDAFRQRVRKSIVRFFKDPYALEEHLSEIIGRWVKAEGAGILGHTAAMPRPSSSASVPGKTSSRLSGSPAVHLGRAVQTAQFDSVLGFTRRKETIPGLCFIVQGDAEYGHHDLIENLRTSLGHSHEHIPIPIGTNYPTSRSIGLIRKIAGWMDAGSTSVDTIPELAQLMKSRKLNSHDVVITLKSAHKFDGGLPGVIQQFWAPLFAELGDACPFKLIMFLTVDQSILPIDDMLLLYPDANKGAEGLTARQRAVALQQLAPFQLEEIQEWLVESVFSTSPDEAKKLAEAVFIETQGIPSRVYRALKDAVEAHS